MWDDIRAQQLADNIRQDLDLLKSFEDEMRYETNPRLIGKYQRDIERQRASLLKEQREYEELKKKVASAKLQNMAELLQQKKAKLDAVQTLLNEKLLPQVWNVPYSRNPNFTGREDILKVKENTIFLL